MARDMGWAIAAFCLSFLITGQILANGKRKFDFIEPSTNIEDRRCDNDVSVLKWKLMFISNSVVKWE